MDFPKQEITLYHRDKTKKQYKRYNLIASVRDTSILNRNNTGVSSTDKVLIRVFESDNKEYEVEKEDLIVNKSVNDEISYSSGLTELREAYGESNTYKITSIDRHIYGEELDHIKIGAV
jgi:peptidyl-tRNA hydrolase